MQNQRITTGRDPRSDIRVPETFDTVSNNHADIERRGDVLTFIDHSTNGTVINGQKIHNTEVGIYPCDQILLAGTFEVDWQTLGGFFPQQHRPTVARNVHAETMGGQGAAPARKTVRMETPHQPAYQSPKPEPTLNSSPQHVDSPYGQENTFSQAEMDRILEKWNWGAFFCHWIWGVSHKQYWTLAIILAGAIPYLGIVATLAICVYLGMKGSRLAWQSGRYDSFEKYVSAQKKWTIGGLIWFIISVAVQAFVISFVLQTI